MRCALRRRLALGLVGVQGWACTAGDPPALGEVLPMAGASATPASGSHTGVASSAPSPAASAARVLPRQLRGAEAFAMAAPPELERLVGLARCGEAWCTLAEWRKPKLRRGLLRIDEGGLLEAGDAPSTSSSVVTLISAVEPGAAPWAVYGGYVASTRHRVFAHGGGARHDVSLFQLPGQRRAEQTVWAPSDPPRGMALWFTVEPEPRSPPTFEGRQGCIPPRLLPKASHVTTTTHGRSRTVGLGKPLESGDVALAASQRGFGVVTLTDEAIVGRWIGENGATKQATRALDGDETWKLGAATLTDGGRLLFVGRSAGQLAVGGFEADGQPLPTRWLGAIAELPQGLALFECGPSVWLVHPRRGEDDSALLIHRLADVEPEVQGLWRDAAPLGVGPDGLQSACVDGRAAVVASLHEPEASFGAKVVFSEWNAK